MYDYVVDFFKYMGFYNEEYFETIRKNTKVLNMPYGEIKDLIGCFITDDSFKLLLPRLNSIYDVLIYVHEYTHAIFLDSDEIFPNIMEAYFINYFVLDESIKLEMINRTKKEIKESKCSNHTIAKKIKLLTITKNS